MAHILVVDQDDILAELAAGMLAAAGHTCSFATGAAEAWRMIHWRRPDLLLLDEAMADGDGNLLRRLAASPAGPDFPVIQMTTADTAAPEGLTKPLQPRIVHERVARLLETSPAKRAEFQLHDGQGDAPRRVYL